MAFVTKFALSAASLVLVPSERRESTNRVSLNARTALAGGDYSLTIGSRDGVAGVVAWTVTLKSPKRYAFALPDLGVDGVDGDD